MQSLGPIERAFQAARIIASAAGSTRTSTDQAARRETPAPCTRQNEREALWAAAVSNGSRAQAAASAGLLAPIARRRQHREAQRIPRRCEYPIFSGFRAAPR